LTVCCHFLLNPQTSHIFIVVRFSSDYIVVVRRHDLKYSLGTPQGAAEMKENVKRSRHVAMVALATAGVILDRQASAAVVTLTTSQTSSQNWSTTGAWSDGSNPASNTSPTTTNIYNVSTGQVLYSPTIANSGTDYFYGAGLNLTGATLYLQGSSASTYYQSYNFPNGVIQSTDSNITFVSTNATTQNLSAGVVFSDTGSAANTILVTTGSYTHYVNLRGQITGSGTLNFNYSGGASGRNLAIVNGSNAYTGAVVLEPLTTTAATFNLNTSLGTVTSYTIGTLWTLNDAASNNINGSNVAITGTLKIAGSTEMLGNLSGGGSINTTGALSLTLNGAGTYTGFLNQSAGTASLIKNGSGIQILSGTSNYTGTTAINGGTLKLGTFTGSGEVDLNAGTLAGGVSTTLAGNVIASSSAATTIAPGGIGTVGTLTLGTATTSALTTFNFDLGTGNGEITNGDLINFNNTPTIANSTPLVFNNSSATMIGNDYRLFGGSIGGLTAANFALPSAPAGQTYTVSTDVDPGYIDLVVGSSAFSLFWDNAGGSGDGLTWDTTMQNWNNGTSVTTFSSMNGDNVTFNDTNNGHYNVVISGIVTPDSTLISASGNYNFSGSGGIGGTGPLNIAGPGTLNLATSNTFTGQTNLAGGVLNLQNTLALQNSTVNISGGALAFASTVTSNQFIIGGLTGSGNIALLNFSAAPITLSIGNNSTGTTYSGSFSGPGAINKIGSGTLTLTGQSTFTGGATLTGGILNLGTNENGTSGPLGETGLITFAGGTLQYSGANSTDYSSRFAATANQPFIIDTNSQNVTFAAPLVSTGGSLMKLGSGMLTLGTSGTYTGSTTIAAGTLQLGAPNALPVTTTVIFTGTSELDSNGYSQSVAGLSVAGGVTASLTGTVTTSLVTFSSNTSGSTLTGGTLSMTAGVIDASAAGGSNVASGITTNVATQINGTGGLTLNAFGNTTDVGGGNNSLFELTNTANSFTGGVTITQGLVTVNAGDGIFNNSASYNTNAVTINAGAGLEATSNTTLNTASFNLSGAGHQYVRVYGGDTLTLNGSVTGTGGLYKTDGGTLTLAGTNSYTGVTSVPSGTVIVTGDNSQATGGWLVGNNSSESDTVYFNSGAIVDSTGTIELYNSASSSGYNAYLGVGNTGTATVNNSGALIIYRLGELVIGSGSIWNQSGGLTVAVNTTSSYSAALNVNGVFNYNGSSRIILAPSTSTSAGPGAITVNGSAATFTTGQGFFDNDTTSGGAANFNLANGATLVLSANIPVLTNTSGSTLNVIMGTGGGIINTNGFNTSISSAVIGTGSLTLNGGGTLTLAGTNTFSGGTTINAGTLALTNGKALPLVSNLSINTSSGTVLSNHSTGSAFAASINNLTNSGLLDLGNNAAIIHSGQLSTLYPQVISGYNNGAWNGTTGITSSAAAADSTHLTAVGILVNDNGSGLPLYGASGTIAAAFEGIAPSDGDVLLKYTYYGDTNLDGKVDGSDYSRIDASFLSEQTNGGSISGWSNGDFNYDGVINGSDYTLIDNAFNTQGAVIASELAGPDALATAEFANGSTASSVPEPATLSLLLAGAWMGSLGRRRRRS
jgi:fibronectin-binding autotransporter adhesin